MLKISIKNSSNPGTKPHHTAKGLGAQLLAIRYLMMILFFLIAISLYLFNLMIFNVEIIRRKIDN